MKRLVIVTGASRGIGAGIATEANKKYNKDTVFVLLARDEAKLNAVKSQMATDAPENKHIVVKFDFGKNITVEENVDILNKALADVNKDKFEELYVYYNHGTMKIGKIEDVANHLSDEYQINVVSVWILLAAVRKVLPLTVVKKQYHINISSDWAQTQSDSVSVYNTTRIARETLFKCLAIEQPEIRNFSYWPGAVYTDMLKQVYDAPIAVTDSFKSGYEEQKYLTVEQSVGRLFELIDKNEFKNGDSIDYYTDVGFFDKDFDKKASIKE